MVKNMFLVSSSSSTYFTTPVRYLIIMKLNYEKTCPTLFSFLKTSAKLETLKLLRLDSLIFVVIPVNLVYKAWINIIFNVS